MNQRERILAATVGLLLVAVGVSFGARRVLAWFETRRDQIAQLEEQLQANEVIVHRGKLARRALDVYIERGLPSNTQLASSRYRAWLHDWVERVGIQREDVKYTFARRRKDVYDKLTFSVTCEGDLKQLTELLFDFYSTDYLHRIKHMSAKRLEGKRLALAFTIEAISLLESPEDKELGELSSERLAFDDVTAYYDVIVNRNLYAPPNQPPRFASSGRTTGYLNQRFSFRPDAKDPDNDQVTYRLGDHDIDGLTFDERSGEISWTPREKGEYQIPVFAIDNGLPSKEVSQTLTVEVTDPPPPPQPDPGPPAFDSAKYTFVTGIVEVNDRPQVWLTDRTAGQLIKRFEGETIEIGPFKGTIVRIHERKVEIDSEGTRFTVQYGQSIGDARVGDQES